MKPNLAVTVLTLCLLSACVNPQMLRVVTPQAGDLIKTELYFGRNIPGGGVVGEPEWARFLSEEITPRFKDGLTIYEASGQWLGANGRIARERSMVVVLVYRYASERDQAIQSIMDAYKNRFRQEAVMRIDLRVRRSF